MATAIKETKIETSIYGYARHSYRDAYIVRVRIFGQGPKGKLSAIALVGDNGRDYDLRGDGRYSAKHGNSGLYPSEPIYPEIKAVAIKAAQEWVAATPDALHEHKVREATEKVTRLQGEVTRAQAQLDTNRALLAEAREKLKELTGVSG